MNNEISLPMEWRGVTQVINKKSEGIYRANVTTLAFASIIISIYLLISHQNNTTGQISFEILGIILFVLMVVWAIGFAYGYNGIAAQSFGLRGSYYYRGATSNTNYKLGGDSVWSDPLSPGNFAQDMNIGRLTATPHGIGGIIAVQWKDLISANCVDSQSILITRVNRQFGIQVGKGQINLHFLTQEDCFRFLTVSMSMLTSQRTLVVT